MHKKTNKIITKIFLSMFWFISVSLLYGCSYDSDNDIAVKNLEKLLIAIENEDHDGIKTLFAPNIIADIDNFDQSIIELMAYYNGNYESYGSKGLGSEYDRHDGVEKKWLNMGYDITTTEDVYRIAIIWHIQDTSNAGNIGIWSLYIIRFDDDPNSNYTYAGDGLWTNGIHMGIMYPKVLNWYLAK